MPYSSPAQSRFIHAKASEGVNWAQKFVNDSKGTKVPPKFSYVPKQKPMKMRYLQGPYKGASPGIGKKKRKTFEQQIGQRPSPSPGEVGF